MNILHSSRSDSWGTPSEIVERARTVLGGIDLDPASSASANRIVRATSFFTREQDGLQQCWAGAVFLNPPGGKRMNQSLTGLFWRHLMQSIENRTVSHAVFLAFSVEALQMTQKYHEKSLGCFPLCVPKKRIAFTPDPPSLKNAPSHSNVIAYTPGYVDRTQLFVDTFQDLGVLLNCKEPV